MGRRQRDDAGLAAELRHDAADRLFARPLLQPFDWHLQMPWGPDARKKWAEGTQHFDERPDGRHQHPTRGAQSIRSRQELQDLLQAGGYYESQPFSGFWVFFLWTVGKTTTPAREGGIN